MKRLVGASIVIMMSLIISSCSTGLRLKNIINYPVMLSSLEALDTLSVFPDKVKFTSQREDSYRSFDRDIRIQGRQETRPVWISDSSGCFQVVAGAEVMIQDFNFQGTGTDTVLIKVESGGLILENCDFSSNDNWAIQVGEAGYLELRNVRFANFTLGAIKLDGGTIKIFNSEFDLAGQTAIYASSGKQFEAHQVLMTNTMGTGIELNSVAEVWLDSVKVIDSFQDGIHLNDCAFALFNQVESRKNGRNGLYIQNAVIGGLLGYYAIGNLVNGMVVEDVDTLRVLNSEFVGNGENGGRFTAVANTRMAGIQVGHNGSAGFQILGGEELRINQSAFLANPGQALKVDSIPSVQISYNSILNNRDGVSVSHFDQLEFKYNFIKSNSGKAILFSEGEQIIKTYNLIKENQNGLIVEDVQYLQLDSNIVESNKLGTDFRSIDRLAMQRNTWKANESASYFSDMGTITSDYDRWEANTEHAFEVLSAHEFILSNAVLTGNTNSALLNQVSVKLEACVFDSSAGYAVKLMNGSLKVNQSKFRSNTSGIILSEGSQAKIVQSEFSDTELAVDAEASVSLSISFCKVSQAQTGLQIGNYSKTEVLASTFHEIDDFCIVTTGPHLQSLYLRQNVISNAGGVLKSGSNSGTIDIFNNTFVNNQAGLVMREKTLNRLDHNIFFQTGMNDFSLLKEQTSVRWNCFTPESKINHPAGLIDQNLYADPVFEEQFYLSQQSPCLQGGEHGLLIGALGLSQEKRPGLRP